MHNTLTLSADMNTLYLIDNERVLSFPINTENGVLIGLLNGQLTATSAPDDLPVSALSETERQLPAATSLRAEGGQWGMTFNAKSSLLFLVGADDIEGTRNVGGDDIEGTRSVGGDDIEGTRSVGGDDIEGTRGVGADDIEGTRTVGGDDIEGTRTTQEQTAPRYAAYSFDLNKYNVRICKRENTIQIDYLPR